MKTIVYPILLVVISLFGCTNKEEFHAKSEDIKKINEVEKITDNYLDKLDSQKISNEEASKILCHDFPEIYKSEYMPTLLKVSSDYTEDMLLKDMDDVIQTYKEVYKIECNN